MILVLKRQDLLKVSNWKIKNKKKVGTPFQEPTFFLNLDLFYRFDPYYAYSLCYYPRLYAPVHGIVVNFDFYCLYLDFSSP
jgi:hypothetical protein